MNDDTKIPTGTETPIDVTTQSVNADGNVLPVREGTNAFGGQNPAGLYVPISEDEQDALHRLVEAQDLKLVIHGFGVIENPKMIVGDLRVRVDFKIVFEGLLVVQPLWYLDLELQTGAGETLFRERQSTVYNDEPIELFEGLELCFRWDIALKHLDPDLVKRLTGAIGLTSRLQDKDTKDFTLEGNMNLDGTQKRLLRELEGGENEMKAHDLQKTVSATAGAGHEIKETGDGIVSPLFKPE